ncbi:hypothetical protein NUM3379_09790 [Kineococcus sp. NUM-3379]
MSPPGSARTTPPGPGTPPWPGPAAGGPPPGDLDGSREEGLHLAVQAAADLLDAAVLVTSPQGHVLAGAAPRGRAHGPTVPRVPGVPLRHAGLDVGELRCSVPLDAEDPAVGVAARALAREVAVLTEPVHADRSRRSEILLLLLARQAPPALAAELLGLRADADAVVCAVRFPAGPAERAAELVQGRARTLLPAATWARDGQHGYLLLPGEDVPGVAAFARAVSQEAHARGTELLLGVGGAGPAPGSADQARTALRVLAARGARHGVAVHDELREAVALQRVGDALTRHGLPGGALPAVAEHDRRHGTAYLPTLRAWFDAAGDVRAAAAAVRVHPNSLRHRVRRAVELFGLDLDDPDSRLALEVAVRAWRRP